MTKRVRCAVCHPHPHREMAASLPQVLNRTARTFIPNIVRAKSKRRRRQWLRAIPNAFGVWAMPLGIVNPKSKYHRDHPQHFVSCGRAIHAHYPDCDISDVLKVTRHA